MIYGRDILFHKHIADGVEAENGDYIVGETSYGSPIQCDAEPAGKANTLTFPDGEKKAYSYVICLNVDTEVFQVGDHVKLLTYSHAPDALRDSNGRLILDKNKEQVYLQASREYIVLGFHRYNTHCKIWV